MGPVEFMKESRVRGSRQPGLNRVRAVAKGRRFNVRQLDALNNQTGYH